MLTKAEAYRAVAEKLLNKGKVKFGICCEIQTLVYAHWIAWEQCCEMIDDDIGGHLDEDEVWAFERGTHHEERAMACYWLALEAEEGQEEPVMKPVTQATIQEMFDRAIPMGEGQQFVTTRTQWDTDTRTAEERYPTHSGVFVGGVYVAPPDVQWDTVQVGRPR